MTHVFLSFVEEDLNVVNLFRGQAKNAHSDSRVRRLFHQGAVRQYELSLHRSWHYRPTPIGQCDRLPVRADDPHKQMG